MSNRKLNQLPVSPGTSCQSRPTGRSTRGIADYLDLDSARNSPTKVLASVIVPFLHQGVVVEHQWLGERQFLDAVAMGLITPGPVVIMATFVGYLAAGFAGASLATIGVFAPVWVFNVVIGRLFLRHRQNRQVRAFVKGATAAAVGAIAGAALILAQGGFLQGVI